jgi:4,5-DOPA dioxygenase extradiol
MPAAFIGHGNPMNAIEVSRYSSAWRELGERLPTPKAVLVVSAHWYTSGTAVTAMEHPRTIHDFYGFPRELYAVRYPAPGDPALARRIAALLAPAVDVQLDSAWGLDHGTWSVLVHLFPQAQIPVLQLSIDARKSAREHWEIGAALNPLRDEGVLIVGSGNVVHNLRALDFGADGGFDWAQRFDARIARALETQDSQTMIDFAQDRDGRLAVPTPDHYLPLLYVAAMRRDGEALETVVDGLEAGSLSMRSIAIAG